MGLSKQDHLDPAKGPKRILALDGGGIRGILTLQFLKTVETLVKQRLGGDALLCDYFDLIGGTSTGSLIAAGLACGMTVEALQELYGKIGASVFQPGGLVKFLPESLQGKFAPKFASGPLQRELDRQLGADTTLDSDKIRTGLMIMTKRLDTGSPWPLNNGGRGKYAAQDGALRLTQIVRASAAAPTYFAPEEIVIHSRDGTAVSGAFVDGGVTPFNDPALQLLMLAALQGHGFCWSTGRDRLLIVSVGTGQYRQPRAAHAILADPAALQGLAALQSLMDDCERMNRATLQWLTNCLTPWLVDRAIGDMKLDSQAGPQLATYVRYNVLLERDWLKTELGLELAPDKIEQIRKMDDPSNLSDLAELGRLAAAKQVKPEHLPADFDLPKA
ncbi:MAG TPA: patatin-like phospholipase family protein [Stellaceae bacterium]